MKLNLITLVPVIAVAIFLVYGHFVWTPRQIAGVIILIPSLALLIVARLQLGDAFAIQAKAQKLVTHGLYSKIRNPIYVFGGLTILGFFLFWNPWWLLAFIVLIPMQIIRARKEQAVLAATFGEEYEHYKKHTWF
jgi:protein-S-isoprenylcysteine O-methyltransferase Ste14